jgi:hypothetical protein
MSVCKTRKQTKTGFSGQTGTAAEPKLHPPNSNSMKTLSSCSEPANRQNVSVLEQTGQSDLLSLFLSHMSITKHIPDHSPGPTGSACPGYPRGVWPPVLSAFCVDRSPANPRHPDCSMPGCTCTCHARPQKEGAIGSIEQRKEGKGDGIDESKLEKDTLDAIGKLDWLEILGTNRDSTRVPLRK